MVPTSAMPKVSQVVAPHRSCRIEETKKEKKKQTKVRDRNRRDLRERKGILGAFAVASQPARASMLKACGTIRGNNPGQRRWPQEESCVAHKEECTLPREVLWEEIRRFKIKLQGPHLYIEKVKKKNSDSHSRVRF